MARSVEAVLRGTLLALAAVLLSASVASTQPCLVSNLDSSHENHSDERDDSDSDIRRQIPGGIWTCSGSPCAPNTQVQSSMTSARLVSIVY